MDRLTSIAYTRGPDDLLLIDYAYDEATGMITSRVQTTDHGPQTTDYTYDSLDRLTGETYRNGAGQIVDESAYTYDLAGNRLTKTRNGALVEYTLGAGNRMTNWTASAASGAKALVPVHGYSTEPIGLDSQFGERTVNQAEVFAAGTNFWSPAVPVPLDAPTLVAAIGDLAGNVGFATNTILLNLTTNAAYAYDMAGNVTNISYNAGEQTVGLVWNSQYELTAVHTNGALAESYRYDPLGRRVRTITGTVTNYHLYNGIHSLADLDATGAVLRAYTYGPGIDNLLAMTTFSASETNHYYYLTDHLGSVLAIADEDGEIVERCHYDAWGRVTITDAVGLPLTESAIGNRFGFQGREHPWVTGLIHFRARWYDPITGRWLSNDPIGISGGLNQYVAFGNNPVLASDPMGTIPKWVKYAVPGAGAIMWAMQKSIDIQAAARSSYTIGLELESNAKTMSALRRIIRSEGELTLKDVGGFALKGRFGVELSPMDGCTLGQQELANLFEDPYNLRGWASGANEAITKIALGFPQMANDDMMTPGKRKAWAEAMLNRQEAYDRFLVRALIDSRNKGH